MGTSNQNINRLYFSFLLKLLMVTLFTALMLTGFFTLFPEIAVPSKSISIFIVLFGVTAGIHYILLRAGRGEARKLASLIILSVVIKLFLYAVFTFLLILSDRAGAMGNVILFFVGYIIFTVFEISTMYFQLKSIHNNPK